MNDITIETILFNAPHPVASPELLRRLQAEITLPAKSETEKARGWQSPLRRWFPALAFSLFLLSCAIVVAVQGNWAANLKRQNESLRVASADLSQLRQQHAALDQILAQQAELEQLRKDNQEMHQLQAEAAQLGNLPGEIRRLQDENRRLSAPRTASAPPGNGNFFDDARQQAERIQCVNNLKQLGLAMRIWAGDNNDKYPTSLVVMSNELSTVKILICPGDKERQNYSTLTFGQFQDDMTSYQYLAQPDDGTHPDCITAKCPIHNNYLLADGSVQQVDPSKVREVKRDGRLYYEPINPGSNQ